MARPRLPDDKKHKRIQISLSPDAYKLLQNEKECNLSDYISRLIIKDKTVVIN